MTRLRIGISSCLLGDQVRFDGGHRRDTFLTETLAPFVEWIRVCPEDDRLRKMFEGRWAQGSLVAFHTAHKMALLAHSTTAYQALGRLVAGGKGMPRAELQRQYEAGFMSTLARPATTKRHTNVLLHMAGQTYLEPHPRELMLRNHV